MAPLKSKASKKSKKIKWHQHWWGIMVLIFIALILIYAAAILYQSVVLLELMKQGVQQPVDLPEINNGQTDSTAYLGQDIREVVETDDDPFYGNDNAQIVIVEFSDFLCPQCKKAHPVMLRLRQDYQNEIKFIYRDMPNISARPLSLAAAMAAECAADQESFWDYHDLLFINQNKITSIDYLKSMALTLGLDAEEFDQCLDSEKYRFEVVNDLEDGAKLGVRGTPTFFVNGAKIQGVLDYQTFREVIEGVKKIIAEGVNP